MDIASIVNNTSALSVVDNTSSVYTYITIGITILMAIPVLLTLGFVAILKLTSMN